MFLRKPSQSLALREYAALRTARQTLREQRQLQLDAASWEEFVEAIRNQDKGGSRTFVTITDDGQIGGYYSLSSFTVMRADTGDLGIGMPDPVPVTLIGRLAGDPHALMVSMRTVAAAIAGRE